MNTHTLTVLHYNEHTHTHTHTHCTERYSHRLYTHNFSTDTLTYTIQKHIFTHNITFQLLHTHTHTLTLHVLSEVSTPHTPDVLDGVQVLLTHTLSGHEVQAGDHTLVYDAHTVLLLTLKESLRPLVHLLQRREGEREGEGRKERQRGRERERVKTFLCSSSINRGENK